MKKITFILIFFISCVINAQEELPIAQSDLDVCVYSICKTEYKCYEPGECLGRDYEETNLFYNLPPTNFVVEDGQGRFWITVSTRLKPRALGYRPDCGDGFIVRVDSRGASIVADGLGYTNEVAVHPSGQWLYINETFARRLSRFALHADGTLGATKEVVAEFGPGTFPDGLAFDEQGYAWVVSIVSNRLIRVAPDGTQTLWLEESDPAHLAAVESAYESGTMGRPHLDGARV